MTPAHGTLRVCADLVREAAEFICDRAARGTGPFHLCLSGGSTPRPVYEALAAPGLRERFPWDRTHFLFGDERFVPPGDPSSNARMVREAMLDHVPVPPDHIHPVPTLGLSPDEAAAAYERELRTLYGAPALQPDRPLLGLCLLGLGDDGHTASLLPGQDVLQERRRWVAAVAQGRPETRITLTYPALESSRIVLFLVAGKGKQAMLDRILSGDADPPAGRLRPQGELLWFADRDAAGRWAT